MTQIRVGICGLGFMGKMHFDTYSGLRGVKVVAIAETDPKKRKGDWSGIGGNITGKWKGVGIEGLSVYKRIEDLISDENVDVVDITLPSSLHSKYAIMAMAEGKAVICEKPMAPTSREAARMVDAAKKYDAILCIAHCLRFWPEYAAMKAIVDSGRYGKVIQAAFTRLSAVPDWSPWFRDGRLSGGAVLDLHIHDADFVQYLLGLPDAVVSVAAGDPHYPDHIATHYIYTNRSKGSFGRNLCVTAEGGWLFAPSFPFHMSFRIRMEKATLTLGWGSDPGLVLFTPGGKVIKPKLAKGDGYSLELDYFIRCIRNGKKPEIVTPESSLASIRLVEAEIRSAASSGRRVSLKN